MKLNLGCGMDVREGWVNLDKHPYPGVDVVHDLKDPLPFPDGCAEHIRLSHVLEHIADWPEVMVECHRVLRPRGSMEVRVPYGVGPHNYTANHIRAFWPKTMDMFLRTDSPALDEQRYQGLFELEDREIRYRLWGSEHILYRIPLGCKQVIVWRLRKANGVRA